MKLNLSPPQNACVLWYLHIAQNKHTQIETHGFEKPVVSSAQYLLLNVTPGMCASKNIFEKLFVLLTFFAPGTVEHALFCLLKACYMLKPLRSINRTNNSIFLALINMPGSNASSTDHDRRITNPTLSAPGVTEDDFH